MPYTLAELAEITQSKLIGNPKHVIHHVADLDSATSEDISFLNNPKYAAQRYEQAMRNSKAGAVFIQSESLIVEGRNFLVHDNPSGAFQQIVELLSIATIQTTGFQGIHPTAVIHETVTLGQDVSIGPYVILDKHVVIGDRCSIQAHCSIGPGTILGDDCHLYPHVTIREQCKLGNRVIIQPGAVIGSCGFGYTTDNRGKHTKLKQLGSVVLEDEVEIGANTTIDRARFKETRIGKGTKIDNLVQIGHGVKVGEGNLIVAQTGIAGSTETGRFVVLGGQVAVNGHIKLGDGVIATARTGISKSLPDAGKYGGAPAQSLSEYNRNTVLLRNIETYLNEIKELKKRLESLESK